MENKSFLGKILYVIIGIVFIVIATFFFMNKGNVSANMDKIEMITSMNADSYDMDMYIYKLDGEVMYTSEYFYNNFYLSNNEVTFDEYEVSDETKFYLKTLSNTETDIDNIKISYDPISKEEFLFLLENYNLLKVNIWLDDKDNCQKVLLYSSNNMELVLEEY